MKLFNFPVKTFDPNNLLEEMMESSEGTVFVLGQKVIKTHEGDDSVESVMAQIRRVNDSETA